MIRLIEMLENKEINEAAKLPDAGTGPQGNTAENNATQKSNENLFPIGSCGKVCSQCKVNDCGNRWLCNNEQKSTLLKGK